MPKPNPYRSLENGAELEQLRVGAHLTLDDAAKLLEVPKRTFHDWTRQKSPCPNYALRLFRILVNRDPEYVPT